MNQKIKDWIRITVFTACILMIYLFAYSALAQTPQRAWLSAGEGCEGGSKLTYTVGVPFKVSFCAQNEVPSCGFTVQMEADTPNENGLFLITGRTLHHAFSDPNTLVEPSPAKPFPIVSDPANSPYYFDLGGTGIAGDASLYDNHPLLTLTLVATPAAAAERRVIGLSDFSVMGIPIPDPQYPNQPCANGYDVPFGLTPIYLDASTLATPWSRVSYGVARLRSNLE